MCVKNYNFRYCEFFEEKIIDRYNKTNADQTTELYKELFNEEKDFEELKDE